MKDTTEKERQEAEKCLDAEFLLDFKETLFIKFNHEHEKEIDDVHNGVIDAMINFRSKGQEEKWISVEDKEENNEAFFIDENFYSDISDYVADLDLNDEDITALPDDYTKKIQLATLEPLFTPDKNFFENIATEICQWEEERFPEEDHDERIFKGLVAALKNSFDKERFIKELPKLYYPNGKFDVLTKKDLVDWL